MNDTRDHNPGSLCKKALFHGLGKQKVEEFMTTGGPVANPGMPMAQLEKIMIAGAPAVHARPRTGKE